MIKSYYIEFFQLPAWNHGDKLLKASFVGLFLSVAKYLSLLLQNDSNISRPASVPALAQSTSLTARSTSMKLSTASQSTAFGKLQIMNLYKHTLRILKLGKFTYIDDLEKLAVQLEQTNLQKEKCPGCWSFQLIDALCSMAHSFTNKLIKFQILVFFELC